MIDTVRRDLGEIALMPLLISDEVEIVNDVTFGGIPFVKLSVKGKRIITIYIQKNCFTFQKAYGKPVIYELDQYDEIMEEARKAVEELIVAL